jgi:hypothetical protein
MWSTNAFIGADSAPSVESRYGEREVYSDIFAVGPFQIPRTIIYSEGNERRETYTVRKVEFLSQPSTNWFEQVKGKHFERVNSLQKLEEPGISPAR